MESFKEFVSEVINGRHGPVAAVIVWIPICVGVLFGFVILSLLIGFMIYNPISFLVAIPVTFLCSLIFLVYIFLADRKKERNNT